jgi:dipeptidyl aminopeptidase/acylaminoacyl peptidase
MRVLVIAALTGSVLMAAPAQQTPPATEVFLKARTGPDADIWINISNNPGYDNQPSFLPDSSGILFSSNRDGKQTDIYRYDIRNKRLTQLTKTPEAEYSPTVTPDRRSFSAVRVEADDTQRLWRFDRDGENPRVLLENMDRRHASCVVRPRRGSGAGDAPDRGHQNGHG